MDFDTIISINVLAIDCKATLCALFVLFIDVAIATGYISSEIEEFASSNVMRTIAIRQLLCADIRYRATIKRLVSARIRKAFKVICKECASVAILRSIKQKAIKFVAHRLSEKLAKDFVTHGHLGYDRDHNHAIIACIENLAGYIKGKRILLVNAMHAVYVVIEFTHFGATYYGVWERQFVENDNDDLAYGYDDYCDPNFLVVEKLYDAKTTEEIIKITCDDLQKYIMNGRIFTSLDEIGENAKRIGYDFYADFNRFRQNQRRIVAIASPLPAVQELINVGKPVTLRDLLAVTGHENLSTSDGYALGAYICCRLKQKIRQKVEVIRLDQKMMVNLYTPDEFAEIAFLIKEWTQRV